MRGARMRVRCDAATEMSSDPPNPHPAVGRMLLCTKEHHLQPITTDATDGTAMLSPGMLRERTGSLRSSSLTSLASLVPAEGDGDGEAMTAAAVALRGGVGGVADDSVALSLDLTEAHGSPHASAPSSPVTVPPPSVLTAAAGAGASATPSRASSRSATPIASPSPTPMPTVHSRFLPTARRIMQFADGRLPKPEDRVVYICGSFDLFNVGHIAALREARKLGDFLLVGIHDDATVNGLRGHGLPILNLYERTLSLLSCRLVDEVIIGAPWVIEADMIKSMNIAVVARGTVSDFENSEGYEHMGWRYSGEKVAKAMEQAFAVPKALGILRTFPSPSPLTAVSIIDRIMTSRTQFQARYEKKSRKEAEYYAHEKAYVREA